MESNIKKIKHRILYRGFCFGLAMGILIVMENLNISKIYFKNDLS